MEPTGAHKYVGDPVAGCRRPEETVLQTSHVTDARWRTGRDFSSEGKTSYRLSIQWPLTTSQHEDREESDTRPVGKIPRDSDSPRESSSLKRSLQRCPEWNSHRSPKLRTFLLYLQNFSSSFWFSFSRHIICPLNLHTSAHLKHSNINIMRPRQQQQLNPEVSDVSNRL